MKSNDIKLQIECFEKAVEIQSDHHVAWFELGKAYNLSGRPEKAEVALQRALRLSPDNLDKKNKIELMSELADCYYQQKKYESAKSSFFYLLTLIDDPHEQAKINSLIGECYLGLEEYSDALNTFKIAIELEPMNVALVNESLLFTKRMIKVDSLYALAKAQYSDGNFSSAVELFKQLVQIRPNYKNTDTLLADAQMKKKAIQLLADFPEPISSKTESLATTTVAVTPVESKEPPTTEPQPPVSVPPKLTIADSLYRSVLAAIDSDDLESAQQQIKEIKKRDPQYPKLKQLENEIKFIKQTSHELQQVAKFYSSGVKKLRNQDWLGSIIDLEKANLLSPHYKDIDSLLVFANIQLQQPHEETVASVAESSHASMQQGFDRWYSVGFVLSVLFLPLLVAMLFFPEVRARIYLLQGNYYRACQLYETILKREPEKAKIYISLANLYLLKNRMDEKALEVYHNALQVELDMTTRNKIAALVEAPDNDEVSTGSSKLKQVVEDLQGDIKNLG